MIKNPQLGIIVDVLLILCSFGLLIWAGFMSFDVMRIYSRDGQRISSAKKLIVSLERFCKDNNYYPGSVLKDENNRLIYPDWHFLITAPEMKKYFNFTEFKDPCQPDEAVGILGVVECPKREVTYQYLGLDCQTGCRGYQLIIGLERGGQEEFISSAK